jgi:hypothetical protein
MEVSTRPTARKTHRPRKNYPQVPIGSRRTSPRNHSPHNSLVNKTSVIVERSEDRPSSFDRLPAELQIEIWELVLPMHNSVIFSGPNILKLSFYIAHVAQKSTKSLHC